VAAQRCLIRGAIFSIGRQISLWGASMGRLNRAPREGTSCRPHRGGKRLPYGPMGRLCRWRRPIREPLAGGRNVYFDYSIHQPQNKSGYQISVTVQLLARHLEVNCQSKKCIILQIMHVYSAIGAQGRHT